MFGMIIHQKRLSMLKKIIQEEMIKNYVQDLYITEIKLVLISFPSRAGMAHSVRAYTVRHT